MGLDRMNFSSNHDFLRYLEFKFSKNAKMSLILMFNEGMAQRKHLELINVVDLICDAYGFDFDVMFLDKDDQIELSAVTLFMMDPNETNVLTKNILSDDELATALFQRAVHWFRVPILNDQLNIEGWFQNRYRNGSTELVTPEYLEWYKGVYSEYLSELKTYCLSMVLNHHPCKFLPSVIGSMGIKKPGEVDSLISMNEVSAVAWGDSNGDSFITTICHPDPETHQLIRTQINKDPSNPYTVKLGKGTSNEDMSFMMAQIMGTYHLHPRLKDTIAEEVLVLLTMIRDTPVVSRILVPEHSQHFGKTKCEVSIISLVLNNNPEIRVSKDVDHCTLYVEKENGTNHYCDTSTGTLLEACRFLTKLRMTTYVLADSGAEADIHEYFDTYSKDADIIVPPIGVYLEECALRRILSQKYQEEIPDLDCFRTVGFIHPSSLNGLVSENNIRRIQFIDRISSVPFRDPKTGKVMREILDDDTMSFELTREKITGNELQSPVTHIVPWDWYENASTINTILDDVPTTIQ